MAGVKQDSRMNMVLTVGSVLRGDDAAGPMLAKMFEENPVEGWEVIDGGQMPEDDIAYIRRRSPRFLLLVDAADMGLAVGSVRKVEGGDVSTQFLLSTHSLPISFLLSELEQACDEVLMLGIQPGNTGFYEPLSSEVKEGLERIYETVASGAVFDAYDYVNA